MKLIFLQPIDEIHYLFLQSTGEIHNFFFLDQLRIDELMLWNLAKKFTELSENQKHFMEE